MPTTRGMMEDQMKQLMEMIAGIKAYQESTNADLVATIAAGQAATSAAINEIRKEIKNELASMVESAVIETTPTVLQTVKEDVLSVVREEVQEKVEHLEEKVSTMQGEQGKFTEAMEERLRKLETREAMVVTKPDWENVSTPFSGPRSNIKVANFDGKSSWRVYQTQFEMIASANGWDDITKAFHLAASLREEAANVLQIIPKDKRGNLDALTSALELRFGEQYLKDYSRQQLKARQQKTGESLQEFASEIERLSLLAFPDCPADVRDNLSQQYFVDGVGNHHQMA